MKAYVKVYKDNNENIDEYLLQNAKVLSSKCKYGNSSIEDIEFSLTNNYKKGKEIQIGNFTKTIKKTIILDLVKGKNKQYSDKVLEDIIKIVEVLENYFKDFFESKDVTVNQKIIDIMNINNLEKEDVIREIININKHPFEEIYLKTYIINVIGQFLKKHGFIITHRDTVSKEEKCSIMKLLSNFWLIYETFYLYQYYIHNSNSRYYKKMLLFSKFKNMDDDFDSQDIILNNLQKLEKYSSCTFHTIVKETFDLETVLVFKNALHLAVYELRMIVSKNYSTKKALVCQICGKRIKSKRNTKLYCSKNENSECYNARRNKTKIKSLANLNNSKS